MRRIALLVVGMALVLPSTAVAQSSSSCQAYNPQLSCQPVTTTGGTTGTSSGTLPFTGLDIVLLAAGGVVLVGTGLFIRRLPRRWNNQNL